MLLENSEYGIFVKGGKVIPIKLHRNAQSLLRTLKAPIKLDVYLDLNEKAEGELYLDDG
jgi:alpha-glucosidase (family GH31 glycosyl hydrolase)